MILAFWYTLISNLSTRLFLRVQRIVMLLPGFTPRACWKQNWIILKKKYLPGNFICERLFHRKLEKYCMSLFIE